MIRPIMDPSFVPYGRSEQLPCAQSGLFRPIPLHRCGEVRLYCFPYDTSWDYVDGMTVLLIQDNGEQRPFYLDRPVTVYAGISFGFYSLGQNSTVLGNAELFAAENQVACVVPATAAPQLHNIDIFTLFRQTGHDGL